MHRHEETHNTIGYSRREEFRRSEDGQDRHVGRQYATTRSTALFIASLITRASSSSSTSPTLDVVAALTIQGSIHQESGA